MKKRFLNLGNPNDDDFFTEESQKGNKNKNDNNKEKGEWYARYSRISKCRFS